MIQSSSSGTRKCSCRECLKVQGSRDVKGFHSSIGTLLRNVHIVQLLMCFPYSQRLKHGNSGCCHENFAEISYLIVRYLVTLDVLK